MIGRREINMIFLIKVLILVVCLPIKQSKQIQLLRREMNSRLTFHKALTNLSLQVNIVKINSK